MTTARRSTRLMPVLDAGAVGRGALVAAGLSVPFGVIGRWVDDASGVNLALLFAIAAGLAAGGAVAARSARSRPLLHGAVAPLVVGLVAEAVGLVRRAVTETGRPTFAEAVFGLVLAAAAGLVGAALTARGRPGPAVAWRAGGESAG